MKKNKDFWFFIKKLNLNKKQIKFNPNVWVRRESLICNKIGHASPIWSSPRIGYTRHASSCICVGFVIRPIHGLRPVGAAASAVQNAMRFVLQLELFRV
ncbi:hypothetical protein [Brenneria goodwinii]|uniref:hypothetical protein n=1 Tax=Brenneria goodwinii TaxID=1109412 RepID=UPI0011AB85C6|nr:hypothetical protein [Brenneria goodwinii]